MTRWVGQYFRSLMIRIVIVVASAALVGMAASHFIPTALKRASGPMTYDVALTAAIPVSNTTIGVSDADVWTLPPDEANATLIALKSIGVNNIRITPPWAELEPAPGVYNWNHLDTLIDTANALGMGVMVLLSGTPAWNADPRSLVPAYAAPVGTAPFAQFAGDIAARYAGKVSAYEIWNEPNGIYSYWPVDPVGYTNLLKAAYPEIKAADPNATVIGGVLGATVGTALTVNPVDFLQQMYAAGAHGYFDALSFHPYDWTDGLQVLLGNLGLFSDGLGIDTSPITQLLLIRTLMAQNGDGLKLIWGTEYGSASVLAGATAQALHIQNMIDTWKTYPFLGPVFIQDTRDGGPYDPLSTFGLFRVDWTPKLAALVIKNAIAGLPTTLPAVNLFWDTAQEYYWLYKDWEASMTRQWNDTWNTIVGWSQAILSWLFPPAAATAATPVTTLGLKAAAVAPAKADDPPAASLVSDADQSVAGSGKAASSSGATGNAASGTGATGTAATGTAATGTAAAGQQEVVGASTENAASENQVAADPSGASTIVGKSPTPSESNVPSSVDLGTPGKTAGATNSDTAPGPKRRPHRPPTSQTSGQPAGGTTAKANTSAGGPSA